MPRPAKIKTTRDSTANLGFEAKLWLAADKLRNNMDAAEPERRGDSQPQAACRASEARQYKHVVLGLIFLKYISDSFEEHRAKLIAGEGEYAGANPEEPDEPSGARQTATGSPKGERGGANQYRAENVFWVPAEARWSYISGSPAKLPTNGKTLDDAMVAIERDNPRLKGVLPKDYARPALDKHRLGELIDLVSTIGLGDKESRSKDILGRVYEYFLTQFASAEGKNGGQFYTPSCIVRLLVEMLAPYKGRIYAPACGSGGSLPAFRRLRRMRFAVKGRVIAPGGVQFQGQDKWALPPRPFGLATRARRVRLRRQQPKQSSATTRRLGIMNLALRGIEADFGQEHTDVIICCLRL